MSFITMTSLSLINVRYGNVATEIIPQGTAFVAVGKRTKRKCHSVWDASSMVTSILQDQQYMFGVKSLLIVKKVLLICW